MTGYRQGFTLIELLVVIAIIAVLAAILFPVFGAARTRAQMSSCSAKQKQLSAAFTSYLSDWNERFPPGCVPDSPTYICWHKLVRKYISDSMDVAWCPEVPCPYKGFVSSIDWYTSIGANMAVLGSAYVGQSPCRTSEVGTPSKTILLGDSSFRYYGNSKVGGYIIVPGIDTLGARQLSMSPRVNPDSITFNHTFFDANRHGGRVVITHADGHVSAYARDVLLKPGIPVTGTPSKANLRNPAFSMWDLY